MNTSSNYTVQYNVEHLNAPGLPRKPEVVKIHFNTFDEAFRKLYTTDVHYFDKNVAAKSGLDVYMSAAMILQGDNAQPLMKVERTFDPTDMGRREHFASNAALYLTKGDTFKLLDEHTRALLRNVNPLIGHDTIYPLAVYSADGTSLNSSGEKIKRVLSDGPARLQDLPGYAYSVDIHRHTFMNNVPSGAVNGVIVSERTPARDLATAAKTLLDVDLAIVDPLIAFNHDRHEFLTRMSITDLKHDRSIIELKTYKLMQPHNDIPEPGLYMAYASRMHRREAEEALPGLKRLSEDGGTLVVPVARYSDSNTIEGQDARYQATPVNGLKFIDSPAPESVSMTSQHRNGVRIIQPPDRQNTRTTMHQ